MDKKFKILKIDHIAVAVKNLKESSTLFQLLGMDCEDIECVKSENVDVVKIHTENSDDTIELLEPTDDSSAINSFLNKRGQGLHHIALEVDDINNAIKYLESNKLEITSQNHGFTGNPEANNSKFKVTSINLNDHTIEGIRHNSFPIISVQYHPEASPGPHDSSHLFEEFTDLMNKHNVKRYF